MHTATCPAGSPSPAVPPPTVIVGWGLPPSAQLPHAEWRGGSWGRTKSSGQLAKRPILLRHPSLPEPFWSPGTDGQIPSDWLSPRAEDTFRKPCLPQNKVPLPSAQTSPCLVFQAHMYWQETGYPVGKEATGTRTHVPLANEACDDKGRPSALRRALGQMPKVEPPRSLGNLTLHSPEISPTAPCHHGAEVRTPPFVNISSFFYSARILVQNISIDPWKAVSNGSQQASGQSGGQRAEEWAAAPEAHSRL